MAINITTQRLLHILDVSPASQNIMLVGRHGIGKSQILTNYYTRRGMKVVTLFLGQMSDPGDLIGLPAQGSRTTFTPPYWWPEDEQPIVLFLDELNRARPEILQTVMDLTLNRTLAGRSLPSGSRVIAAVNEGDEYQLTRLDPALVSRFNIYHFCPTVQEWLLWAEETGIDSRVQKFISGEPAWLDGVETQGLNHNYDLGLEKQPDRRAWHHLSDTLKGIPQLSEEEDIELVAGIIGAAAASRFFGSLTGRQLLTGAEVLHNFPACEPILRKYLLHQLAMVNESIFRHLELCESSSEGRVEGMGEKELPSFGGTEGGLLPSFGGIEGGLTAYVNLLFDMESREAIAHLANLIESGSYPNAMLFVANRTPEVAQRLMQFIAEL